MITFSIDEAGETLANGKKEGQDPILLMQKENLESAKMKIDEVKEENERLKLTLSQMMKDYNSLKMHFHGIVKQDEEPIKSIDSNSEESDLVSLSLGRVSSEKKIINSEAKQMENGKEVLDGLELGLDCKFQFLGNSNKSTDSNNQSPENSFDGLKEGENNGIRAFDKSPKTSRSEDDDLLQQNPMKKPRVSVRAICDTQTMNDGCQWRKYGQKIAKGNPCPRAYYRCTLSSSCPVRKQVQRCADNMSILITTYEGTHNHPLPPSATTMASATTAATAMLNCGSTTSPPTTTIPATTTNPNNLLRFQFSSPNNHHLPTSYFPRASISTNQSHPTVTLDFTAPNPTHSPYNKTLFSPLLSSSSSSRSLNFSSYNNTSHPYINNHKKNQEEIFASPDDEIAIATKAMARDPMFQTALAAAITSFVGNGTTSPDKNSGKNVISGKEMDFQLSFSQPSTRNEIIACATSYLNKFRDQSLKWQQKNLPSSPPFTIVSDSKSSVAEEGEKLKL